MRDFEIPLPSDTDFGGVEQTIDKAISTVGLTATVRGTLKKYPGCIHWHIQCGRESGTLEVTFWPRKRRAWFTVQSGRQAPWIEGKMKLLRQAIDQYL